MPYTFTHIGYIIPLKKFIPKYLSRSGLIFGSITPDFDILFRISETRFHIFNYSVWDVFFLICPIALVCLTLFHWFCQKPIYNNLPAFFQRSSGDWLKINIIHYIQHNILKILISIILAIYLHLALDFLAHLIDAWSFRILIFTLTGNNSIANISYTFAIYGLPILFSLAGFLLIVNYLKSFKPTFNTLVLTLRQFVFWLLMLLCTGLIMYIKLWFLDADEGFYIDQLLISITGAFILSIYCICLFYTLFITSKDTDL